MFSTKLDYKRFRIFCIVLFISYLFIPVFFFFLVFDNRATINPSLHLVRAEDHEEEDQGEGAKEEEEDEEKAGDDDEENNKDGRISPLIVQNGVDQGRYGDVREGHDDGGCSCSGGCGFGGGQIYTEEELALKLERREAMRCWCVVKFLWQDYHPSYYAFEVVDLLRRIFFVAVLPLLGSGALRA